ncbi:MAG: hypothetical protein O7E52_23620, partial [Candidatus Poribacteria bacterium]|nr:hypothetical protein [Candidatus Poribacteria bacterium]
IARAKRPAVIIMPVKNQKYPRLISLPFSCSASFHDDHASDLLKFTRDQLVEIDAAGYGNLSSAERILG